MAELCEDIPAQPWVARWKREERSLRCERREARSERIRAFKFDGKLLGSAKKPPGAKVSDAGKFPRVTS